MNTSQNRRSSSGHRPVCSAILLAAGLGTRYKSTKQDILFHGIPLWQYPYQTAISVLGRDRVVAVGKDIPGGATRTDSVICGLEALPPDTERVIILEATRPLVTQEQIIRLLDDSAPSVSFVRPLVDAIAYRDGRFIDRSELYALVAPQAFDYQLLLSAYRSGKFTNMTDETRVMLEFHGIKPHFIETESNLFKITYPGDLAMLESIFQAQNSARTSAKHPR